jgi:DNA-binding SARP family transcriptional activator/tetratricopeptide (TPR) repeat protein
MEFRLFGEVELRVAGQLLDVGTPRQQVVLAALLVDAPRPVAIETLVDRVWGDSPPAGARNVLYSHLSRIRQLLKKATARTGGPPTRLVRRHAGYVLDVELDLVDLHRFWRLVEQGHDPLSADAERADVLTEALRLRRGAPLARVSGEWAGQVRDNWHRRRLDAVVEWGRLQLRLGQPSAVVTTVSDLVAEYPLAEPLESLLIRALHSAGRQAEAVDRYALVRQRLAEELGTDPGQELRELHQAILRGELPPPAPDRRAVATGRTVTPPAQLPPDVYGFAGREDELRQLDSRLTATDDEPTAAAVFVLSGTAGVGKTTLAVHWAHRVRDRFPDGQLYVNLRGFDPHASPVTAVEAVRGFLDAFEVPPERIPTGLDAQIGLYRSLLASRGALLVLDNARDAEQVRPLLPGAPRCLVVVTSRDQLSGLVAGGAHPVTLDLLDAAEARELLTRRLGAARTAAEPDAVDEIMGLCARLPLALAVVAARAATHPTFRLAALADELRGGLGEFAGADSATDVRAVFSWSYLQLEPAAARLFRLLGLHPGPHVSTAAAASLAGLPAVGVRPLLAELARAHLVTEHIPGRYACHDLLRAYAAEQAHRLDTGPERDAALRRVFAHYVQTADLADRLLNPYRYESPALPPLPAGALPERLADSGRAQAWFEAEHAVLLAAVRQVACSDTDVWHLGRALRRFLAYRGSWDDEVETLNRALGAARRLADPGKEAFARCFLGCTYGILGRYEDAQTELRAALDLYRRAGDEVGAANTQLQQSWLLDRQSRHREALPYARQALGLFRAAGHPAGQARALNAIGWFSALLGDHAGALHHCQQALELQSELGDRFGEGETLDSLGYAHSHLGHHAQAIACYQAAIRLYRDLQYRYNEAEVWVSLGEAHRAAGNLDSAGSAWRRALDVFEDISHPAADGVRTRLAGLARRGADAERGSTAAGAGRTAVPIR